jgi:multimeric flavodoxin WrbA
MSGDTEESIREGKEEVLKVLGIAGSPRIDGNTDLLLKEFLAGAAAAGAVTKAIFLRDLCVAPCRHCGGCLKTGRCVVKDDMQWLHTELREADCVVLASPIFFMGVTAQAKAMIDRCQALWVLKYVLKLPVALNPRKKRQGFFISVGGMGRQNLFEPALATVRSFFKVLDLIYAGELLFYRIDEKGAIARHPTALQQAFLAGERLTKSYYPEVSSYGSQ